MVVAPALPSFAVTQSGTVDVSGVVPGPPPATPPTIDVPVQNATFPQKTIDVKGSCLANLIVRIFRNEIFAGSALCQADGTFALQIDLTEGRNDLIGRQYDSLNQSSPDSDTVTVYYVPPVQQPELPNGLPGTTSTGGNQPLPSSPQPQVAQFQLIIDYDYSFRGVTANKPLHLPIHFTGGTPPYAVSVSWGDGSQSVVSRESAEQFFVDHVYAKPGTYTVKIRISDKNGNTAYLQFVLVVNGTLAEKPATSLFGQPLTIDTLPAILVPSAAFGAAGFAGGFFFAHRWRWPKFRRAGKSGNRAQKP